MDTVDKVHKLALSQNYEMRVIGILKTVATTTGRSLY